MQGRLLAVASALALACASGSPAQPQSGEAVAWGYVVLVPRAGFEPTAPGGAAYGDRRLRDAELVDYSRPGFAVVYLASGALANDATAVAPGDAQPSQARSDVALTVETATLGPRLVPRHAALAVGDRVVVSNRTAIDQLISCPSVGVVKKLAPGESVAFLLGLPGEHAVHLIGGSGAQTTLFVAPSLFSTVSAGGRFEIGGLAPGPVELRSWHPRFPPSTARMDLAPNEIRRHDIEIGVGRDEDRSIEQESNHDRH